MNICIVRREVTRRQKEHGGAAHLAALRRPSRVQTPDDRQDTHLSSLVNKREICQRNHVQPLVYPRERRNRQPPRQGVHTVRDCWHAHRHRGEQKSDLFVRRNTVNRAIEERTPCQEGHLFGGLGVFQGATSLCVSAVPTSRPCPSILMAMRHPVDVPSVPERRKRDQKHRRGVHCHVGVPRTGPVQRRPPLQHVEPEKVPRHNLQPTVHEPVEPCRQGQDDATHCDAQRQQCHPIPCTTCARGWPQERPNSKHCPEQPARRPKHHAERAQHHPDHNETYSILFSHVMDPSRWSKRGPHVRDEPVRAQCRLQRVRVRPRQTVPHEPVPTDEPRIQTPQGAARCRRRPEDKLRQTMCASQCPGRNHRVQQVRTPPGDHANERVGQAT
mmetsp:Transcript_3344/g.9818  ORF Transcript_3344/g.9818 Transcript_3344/m.9818 type:complete len:386 (-) Transcript_3344:416-1573(-)